MIDLNLIHLQKIKCILAEHVPECEVRAFGSRVAGTAKAYSDFDLVVVGTDKIGRGRLNRLEEAFEASDLPFRVEVLDWHSISEPFRKVIEKQYEVVQEAKGGSSGRAGGQGRLAGEVPS